VIRALLIDLDDTLYDERSYVLSGFRAVAAEIARAHPALNATKLHADMVTELDANGRGRVFDAALARAGITPGPSRIAELVEVYRNHRPALRFWPGVAQTLADLRRDYRLAIITDGLGVMQRNKAAALGLAERVETIVYCWELNAPKPDPAGYVLALRQLGAGVDEAVVIGDRPDHDMAAAAALGCRSIRVRAGRYAAVDGGEPAGAVVADFTQTPGVLRSWRLGATG
jgi:putative hydrolase of the HAD superfamily